MKYSTDLLRANKVEDGYSKARKRMNQIVFFGNVFEFTNTGLVVFYGNRIKNNLLFIGLIVYLLGVTVMSK